MLTGQSLFDVLEAELLSRSIPWKNVVGFASDSASVMVGRHNSVLSRVREKQSKVFTMACVCHLAALSAAAGLKTLPFSCWLIFKRSSKRWQEFADILEDFQDIAPMKVCTTRWLSLERAVRRLVHLWPALKAYFDRESEGSDARPNECVSRVAKLLALKQSCMFCFSSSTE